MSRRANPTVIGGFVLGAIVVAIAGVAIFGSGKLFSRHPRAVAFFQGSIQGLTVGSAVNLRGVAVGAVTDIQLQLDVKQMEPIIPVYMEFDPDRLRLARGEFSTAELLKQEPLKMAIAKGLHARLATQSLVTGQLVVELDLDPDEPSKVRGADPSTVEIPTAESDVEKLKKALTELPLDKIAASALTLLDNANRVVSSNDIPQLLHSLVAAADSFNSLATDARGEFHSTADASRETLASAEKTLAEMRTTLTTANQVLASDVREAIRTAVATLLKAEKTLTDANGLLAPNSPQRYDIDQTLRNLTATTRALRVFAENLERRPNSLVVGK